MKIIVNISEADAELIRQFLVTTKDATACSHGPLDMQKLAAMLLQDVALSVSRPGSWEGSNMAQVLISHGYGS